MAVIYPSLRIPAGSEFEINTAGLNSQGNPAIVDPRTGTLFTDANSTAYVSITDKAGATVLAQTAMSWTAAQGSLPARWAAIIPATACATGSGEWLALVSLYGPGGTLDTLFRIFYRTLNEAD